MDALVEGPVSRYATDLNAGIQRVGGGGSMGNRGIRVPGAGISPYEWMVIGFLIGLFLPSVLLRYLGTGEVEQVSAGDHYLRFCLLGLY